MIMQITYNTVTFPDYSIMNLVATKILFDNIFLASDGNQYFIDTNEAEIIEAIYGDYPYADNRIEPEYHLQWINDNRDRWELDVE